MLEVEVENFQSIEHALVRVDGFTALVGKSNLGKSAIVRAVKAALTGAVGTAFVRHGPSCAQFVRKAKTCECYASVHLRTEGFDLKWEKGDKRNRYTFNGTEYGVPNRGTPEFLERPMLPMDFGLVKVGDQEKLLQIADQFRDSIFLLDQSGGAVADLFSDVARLDRINVATRMVEKDRKESVSTRKVREQDIGDFATRLLAYEGLDEAVAKAKAVDAKLDRISVVETKVSTLSSYIDDVRALGFRVDALQKACALPVPKVEPVLAKHGEFERVRRFEANVNDRAVSIRNLQGVEKVPDPVISPVANAAKKCAQLVTWTTKLTSFQEQFGRFKGFGDLASPDGTALKSARDRCLQLSTWTSRLETLAKTIKHLEVEFQVAVADEIILEKDKKAFGFCPTCEQPIDGHKHAPQKVA
jgi:hypothetical protein